MIQGSNETFHGCDGLYDCLSKNEFDGVLYSVRSNIQEGVVLNVGHIAFSTRSVSSETVATYIFQGFQIV